MGSVKAFFFGRTMDAPRSLFDLTDKFFKLVSWAVLVIVIWTAFFRNEHIAVFNAVASISAVIWFVAVYAFTRGLIDFAFTKVWKEHIIEEDIRVLSNVFVLILLTTMMFYTVPKMVIPGVAGKVRAELIKDIAQHASKCVK